MGGSESVRSRRGSFQQQDRKKSGDENDQNAPGSGDSLTVRRKANSLDSLNGEVDGELLLKPLLAVDEEGGHGDEEPRAASEPRTGTAADSNWIGVGGESNRFASVRVDFKLDEAAVKEVTIDEEAVEAIAQEVDDNGTASCGASVSGQYESPGRNALTADDLAELATKSRNSNSENHFGSTPDSENDVRVQRLTSDYITHAMEQQNLNTSTENSMYPTSTTGAGAVDIVAAVQRSVEAEVANDVFGGNVAVAPENLAAPVPVSVNIHPVAVAAPVPIVANIAPTPSPQGGEAGQGFGMAIATDSA